MKFIRCLFFMLIGSFGHVFGQTTNNQEPASQEQQIVVPIKLSGPRFGLTYIGPGELADRLKQEEISQLITQFGWQFEKSFFSLPSGVQGLVEGVVLVGGIEQNTFLPSASMLIGVRNKNGFEFGVGPNASLAGFAMTFAAGVTFRSNEINFPVNFALVPSEGGLRFSILAGFNARTR